MKNPDTSNLLTSSLLARLGEEKGWSRDPLVLRAYSQDLWPRKLLELRDHGPQPPSVDLVLWPESTGDATEIAQWIYQNDLTVYPYGAGSGVCGATIPGENEKRLKVVVDFKKMNALREIDPISQVVCAEVGWIGENLERRLNQDGFTLGHFPSSIYCSSLGGYLAARSAGQLSTKYGKMEDMVLKVEFVLPNGRTVLSGRAPRSAMGPDWTQLLLGTEGTLGFFTAAWLQIHRLPERRVFQSFAARDVHHALTFSRSLMQEGLRPAVLRIYDSTETSFTISSEHFSSHLNPASKDYGVAVVALFEGSARMTDVEASEALRIANELEIADIGTSLAEHWWKNRYAVSYRQQLILSHHRTLLDTFEVAAPWNILPAVYQSVKSVSVGLGLIMAHFSHFYHTGANIYFTLVSHSGFEKDSVPKYDSIWEKMLLAAYEAGATLSHHHGVGLQKSQWMKKEKADWNEIFKRVKFAFDPENRFNPGKMGL